MSGRVLIVDDEANIRKTLEMIHRNAGWQTASAASGADAMELLDHEEFDVIFLDLSMPGRDGMQVLGDIRLKRPDQVVVIFTGQASIERAIEATRLGAFDFLEKDAGKARILLTSKNALEVANLASENRRLRSGRHGSGELLGQSEATGDIIGQIARVAPTNARVLILGESGTGKELIAHAIHARSPRSDAPFVKVNCAAIPEELIEAELFGSVKGAFTGSVATREGKFQAADGGTIFLDEVGDMSLKVQTKVLRALQEGEIQRVGSDDISRVDVRVIAATNKNLVEEVAGGTFREDLYYRLNVVPIVSPPLRERTDDIPLLTEVFLREYCAQNDMAPKKLDTGVMELLVRYPWPGNVRELRNQVERMVIMCPGRVVRAEDLSAEIQAGLLSAAMSWHGERGALSTDEPAEASPAPANYEGMSLQEARRCFERDMIQRTLEAHYWNVSRAADDLGLERTNLHKKMKVLGINRK